MTFISSAFLRRAALLLGALALAGAQVIAHMATDPLVLWAWAPGTGRSQPPLSHAEFLAGLRAWADQGMPCPS